MAMIGFGAFMTLPDGASDAATAMMDAVTVMFPAQEFGESEVTKLTQSDLFRVFIPTLRDGGMLTVESLYNEADYLRVVALLGKNPKTFTVTDPQATSPLVGTITGWIKKLGEVKFEKDKESVFSFEVRVNKLVLA